MGDTVLDGSGATPGNVAGSMGAGQGGVPGQDGAGGRVEIECV
jgi:hypothetical protein